MSWEDKVDMILSMLADQKSAMAELRATVGKDHDTLTKLGSRFDATESAVGKLVLQSEERDRENRKAWKDFVFKLLTVLAIGAMGALLGKSL